MHRTRIKICGTMRPEDAALACALGADAIGMIFHPPSRRNVSIETARTIVSAMPAFVAAVGVFVDADSATIANTAEAVGLSLVQLHGKETPAQVRELAAAGLRVTKALKVNDAFAAQLASWRAALPQLGGSLAGFVLETPGEAHGGSGVANDFAAIARLQAEGLFAGLPPVIVAGGLTPQNVHGIVEMLQPYAVDVSSGVEETPGCKSEARLRRFFAEANLAS